MSEQNRTIAAAIERLRSAGDRAAVAELVGMPLAELNRLLFSKPTRCYYKLSTLKKSSGGQREIYAVQGEMKFLQRRVLDGLQGTFRPASCAHGFVPGKDILSNARPHRCRQLLIKTDIRDFFPSIHFARAVGMFCAPPFQFGKEAAVTLGRIACVGGAYTSLPQGGVLSPFVANMTCRRLDKRLQELARQAHCHYTRYADDITFSTNDVAKTRPEVLLTDIHAIIEEEGFRPNTAKAKILRPKDRQVVTGVVVNRGLAVPNQYIKSLRATLHNCSKGRTALIHQMVRVPKDERATRCGLARTATGKFVRAHSGPNESRWREYSEEEAVQLFLQHILGRLHFVGQVVMKNEPMPTDVTNHNPSEQDEAVVVRRHERLGERTYVNLWRQYYRVVSSLEAHYPVVAEMRRRAAAMLGKHDELARAVEVDLKDSIEKAKARSRKQHESDSICVEELRRLDRVDSLIAVRSLAHDHSDDPRFALLPADLWGDLARAKREVRRLLKHPAYSFTATRTLLNSWDSDTGLGRLLHYRKSAKGFTPAEVLGQLCKDYYEVYFSIPDALRRSINCFTDAVIDIASRRGPDAHIDLLNDPAISPVTKQLRFAIRLGDAHGKESGLCTSLQDVIRAALEDHYQAAKAAKRDRNVSVELGPISTSRVFTFVPAISDALRILLGSMIAHARPNGTIRLSACDDAIEGGLAIRIETLEDITPLGCAPGTSFAHGDIRNAIRALNGVARYFVEAPFVDGSRYKVDMITQRVTKIVSIESATLVHVIVLN